MPQPHSAPGTGGEDLCGDSPEDMERRDVVSPWEPPLEIRRLLGLESLDWGQVQTYTAAQRQLFLCYLCYVCSVRGLMCFP